MIARKNRFHGRAAIRRLQSTGKPTRSGPFVIKVAANQHARSASEYRLAVVVSRKTSKSAVIRNRIRRRIYERVRILSNSFTHSSDMTIVVYDVRVALMPSKELDVEVAKLLRVAKLTSDNTAQHAIVRSKE